MRPGSLFDEQRLRGALQQLEEADAALRSGRAGGAPDPDVEVIEAFILWQVGTSRASEYLAANLCADALLQPRQAQRETGPFLLAPLARNYLKVFVDAPYVPNPMPAGSIAAHTVDEMQKALGEGGRDEAFPPLQHAIEYDRLVMALDRESTREYLAMLESHAQVLAAMKRGGPDVAAKRQERLAHARKVLAAWQAFDDGLTSNPWVSGTRAVLAAFTLNDVVLSHALWFIAHPDTGLLPPQLDAQGRPEVADRLKMAPIRIAWARRMRNALAAEPGHQQLLQVVHYQEAARYDAYERETVAFEQAFVAARFGAATGAPGKDVVSATLNAANAAAALGLTDDSPARKPYAEALLNGARALDAPAAEKAQAAVQASLAARRLRYL